MFVQVDQLGNSRRESWPEDAQSSVFVRGSSGASCCNSGTPTPLWSFSKDCFIWYVKTGHTQYSITLASWCEKGFVVCHLKIKTHLVKECYRRLQYLLPFAELSLMKLPLKLQDLSPLPRCLRQRTDRKKRGDRGRLKGKEEEGGKICLYLNTNDLDLCSRIHKPHFFCRWNWRT